MTNRLTDPIRKRIKITGKQTQASLGDIWSRLALRLSQIYTHFEKVESHLEKGRAYNTPIEKRITKLNTLFGRGMTANDLIIGAMAELVSVIRDQAEEFSQAQVEMGMMQADLQAQKVEIERAQKTAKKGRYDAANLETVAREGQRFIQDDPDTIKVMLVEVNKDKMVEALKELDEDNWQRLFEAFVTAKDER